MLWELFCQPFAEFDFMWQALLGMFCLALGAAPWGVLLQLRRMSLTETPSVTPCCQVWRRAT